MKHYDVVVVGAGIVGAACALALLQKGLSVALIDQQEPKTEFPEQPLMRVSAINEASKALFERLGVWPIVTRRSPILAMQIFYGDSELQFNAAEFGFTDLGFIVENDVLLRALLDRFQVSGGEFLCPFRVMDFKRDGETWHFDLNDLQVEGALLVVAQGAQSNLRERLQIQTQIHFYNQKGVVTNIESALPHRFTAYQRFLNTGPIAFLPLFNNHWSSIVWTLPDALADQYVQLNETEFLQKLAIVFPDLGELRCLAKPLAFELTALSADAYSGDGFVLVGDAAHTVHPLAGQGVNMGLQDVAKFLELVDPAQLNSSKILTRYSKECHFRNEVLQKSFTGLNRLFQLESSLFQRILSFGLARSNKIHGLKRQLVNIARGQSWMF